MRAMAVWLATTAALALTSTVVQAQLPPTEFEQYQLELINRARANPNAEVTRLSGLTWGGTPNLNEGLSPGTISAAAKQPLAFNTRLIQSAGNYSNTLLNNDDFQHNFGGTTPTSRMTAAGYTFTPPSGSAENIALSWSTASFPITQARVQDQYNLLFVDSSQPGRGHRINLMGDNYREIGIGIRAAGGYTYSGLPNVNAIIGTQDFAYSAGSGPFLTGVAYRDLVLDNFYTPNAGEALGSLTVNVFQANTSNLIATTTTFASGGYSLMVTSGTYDVQFVGLSYNVLYEDIAVSTLNVKLDFVATPEPVGIIAIGAAALAGWRLRRHFPFRSAIDPCSNVL